MDSNTDNLKSVLDSTGTDVFIYSGGITYGTGAQFVDMVARKPDRRQRVLLFLTTFGGDPDAAYRMVRILRDHYGTLDLAVCGPCKSAGTLIALGVDRIFFGSAGELGPLDVQLAKQDEILSRTSVLSLIQAMTVVSQAAYEFMNNTMFSLVSNSGGAISTRKAAELATTFAVGLFTPLMGQIDPGRLGEAQRVNEVTLKYAAEMECKLDDEKLLQLVYAYPTHSFVIGYKAARGLFGNVHRLEEDELGRRIGEAFAPHLRHPAESAIILDIDKELAVATSPPTH